MGSSSTNVARFAICRLKTGAEAFAAFTYPRYRGFLAKLGDRHIAIGATLGDRPAGLALLYRSQGQPTARLLSVSVAPALRRQGLGSALLTAAEAILAAAGGERLVALHSTRIPERQAFERLLARAGWSAPETLEIRGAGRCGAVVAELDRLEPARRPYLPSDIVFGPWSEIGARDREEIAKLLEGPDALPGVSPFERERFASPELSFVARQDGAVVGWVIGEKQSDGVVYYSAGFVVARLRRRGALIGLVREACARQAAWLGPDSVAQLSTLPANPPMARFIRERLEPIGLWVDDYLKSERAIARAALQPNEGEGA